MASSVMSLGIRALGIACLLGLWGCESVREAPEPRELRLLAASSLTEAFQELARQFETEHAGVDVRATFSGSQVLRMQIEQGAQVDLFASANELHVRELVEEGLVTDARTFTHNALVLIVPLDNPAGLRRFEDLHRAQRLVIGTASVPVGAYTRQLFARARAQFGERFSTQVWSRVVSEESNVRLVRAKVELGEADAAIIYRSDAVESERVLGIEIPPELNTRAAYPIAVASASREPVLARQFVEFLLSERGQRTLEKHGFTRRER